MSARIALYSHDALGMGHMRRNFAIARALAADGRGQALLLSGSHVSGTFQLPRGVEVLTLPAVRKAGDGTYAARSLDLPLASILELRRKTISAALDAFAPHVLIADKHPLGLGRELEPALHRLRRRGTRTVLGLREILDDPATVRHEWAEDRSVEAMEELYDSIWVYGDPDVYDAVGEYGLPPSVAGRVVYTGYLAPSRPRPLGWDPRSALELDCRRLVVCTVGGGQDGGRLAEAFALAPLPEDAGGIVVAGPFMPRRTLELLHARALEQPRLRVLDAVADVPGLLARADAIVCMGGYNTVCEVLALRRPALVVPRASPRREQLIRAKRLAARGLVDWLHPRALSPLSIARWLAADHAPPADAAAEVDLHGLARLPDLLAEELRLGAGSEGCLVA